MNLIEALEKEHSKKNTFVIYYWIEGNQERFDELMQIMLTADYRKIQRASWPLIYAAIKHPNLINKHYNKMLSLLEKPNQPVAVKRNILRVLDQIPEIQEQYHGTIMNLCFNYIESVDEPVANQAFALGILQKLSLLYPEIIPEIFTIIENKLPNASPAFKSRAKKFYKYYQSKPEC